MTHSHHHHHGHSHAHAESSNGKSRVALLSVGSNTILIILKLIVGTVTGSVSIISEAIHSGMDLVASLIAYVSVRISDRPADDDHPYGHAKYENVSGIVEALLIIIASGWIIIEAVGRLITPASVEHIGWGTAVMALSALMNFIVSTLLYRTARATGSIALEADALHLRTDVWTSLGVAVGLGVVALTGYTMLDSIVAIGVALFIVREAIHLLMDAFHPLMDRGFTQGDLDQVERIICHHAMGFHRLRTRHVGNTRYIDVHIEMDGEMRLVDAHDVCDRIEEEIIALWPGADVTIHADPDTIAEEHRALEAGAIRT